MRFAAATLRRRQEEAKMRRYAPRYEERAYVFHTIDILLYTRDYVAGARTRVPSLPLDHAPLITPSSRYKQIYWFASADRLRTSPAYAALLEARFFATTLAYDIALLAASLPPRLSMGPTPRRYASAALILRRRLITCRLHGYATLFR